MDDREKDYLYEKHIIDGVPAASPEVPVTVEELKGWLDDPWGNPVANDVAEIVAEKINKRIQAARAEGYREAMEKADLLGDGSMREGL